MPRRAAGFMDWPKLVERALPNRTRLTVLMAHGFGKTTLLAECCRPLSERGIVTAWIPDRRRHDARATRDGWRLGLAPRLAHAVDARTSIAIEPVVEAVSAREEHHASRLFGIGARVSRAFQGGLLVTLGASATVKRHLGPDPVFGTRRIDRTVRFSARVRHRALAFGGFVPYVGLSLERSRSSIPVHEYRIAGVMASVSRAF